MMGHGHDTRHRGDAGNKGANRRRVKLRGEGEWMLIFYYFHYSSHLVSLCFVESDPVHSIACFHVAIMQHQRSVFIGSG